VTIFDKAYKVLNLRVVLAGGGKISLRRLILLWAPFQGRRFIFRQYFYGPTIVLTPKQTVEQALFMKVTVSSCFIGCQQKSV
jgi:hypothetical protein